MGYSPLVRGEIHQHDHNRCGRTVRVHVQHGYSGIRGLEDFGIPGFQEEMMSMDEWIIRYIPDDIMLAIPSDAEHIAWESFPAILEECPEDEDTVGVYCNGTI